MIDFPITELLDDSASLMWLERHLHPGGLHCPRCGRTARRVFRAQGYFPAYRCRGCEAYYTLFTGTAFENPPTTSHLGAAPARYCQGRTHGPPGTRVGAVPPPAQTLRQRIQANLNATAPTGVMTGTAREANELYHNAGKKRPPHLDPTDPARRRANQRQGYGTSTTDRPLLISLIARDPGAQRFWGSDHAERRTCAALIAENIPAGRTRLYTDEWLRDRGAIRPLTPSATVCTSRRGMMTAMAAAKSTATPARELARRSGPTYVYCGAFISRTGIATWRRMKRWSIRYKSCPM